eukprot:TRINITY_DN3021_c0_g1_i1.p1 TRINITY_DN3021_c0_g1~~TRINITY_DN3021_c0_g1_i1.p1  ORF type:complete len:208 (+),score=46.56 TRINITY_DN3021_c0_g1_i1:175-798(+)
MSFSRAIGVALVCALFLLDGYTNIKQADPASQKLLAGYTDLNTLLSRNGINLPQVMQPSAIRPHGPTIVKYIGIVQIGLSVAIIIGLESFALLQGLITFLLTIIINNPLLAKSEKERQENLLQTTLNLAVIGALYLVAGRPSFPKTTSGAKPVAASTTPASQPKAQKTGGNQPKPQAAQNQNTKKNKQVVNHVYFRASNQYLSLIHI